MSSDACKIVARSGYAAINNNLYGSACIKTLADGLFVTASTNKDALEADITGTAVYSGDYIKVGQTEAKAAPIVKPAPAGHTHNFTYSASGATITATCTSGCTLDLDTLHFFAAFSVQQLMYRSVSCQAQFVFYFLLRHSAFEHFLDLWQ